ncbi:Cytochrome b-c1 complex subunit 9, mitochondrial [Madurella fahalii]|uniref:Complex III subunit 9 n=1 Tax=Madurella fahalii TaxID=1157608 RepID=A0ABQ0FX54_9PEZI
MLGVVFAGAFAFEVGYDNLMNRIWDNHNRGVRIPHCDFAVSEWNTDTEEQRQWKDIRHKYVDGSDE